MKRLALPVLLILASACGGGGSSGPDGDVDLLYEETFNSYPDGTLPSAWTIYTHSEATIDGPADWRVLSHRLHQASNVYAPDVSGLSFSPNYEGTLAVIGDTSWVNISLRADVIPHDDDGIGVLFRWQESAVDPAGDFYRLLMVEDPASGGPLLRLDKRIGGAWTLLDSETSPSYNGYTENSSYRIEIDMVISDFTIRVGGQIKFEFTDTDIPKGKIGFFCFGEQGADFDNIFVFRRGP